MMLKLFTLLLFLLNCTDAMAFFANRPMQRYDDNRPLFLESRTSTGRFYIGGNFSWGRGKVSDIRSAGFSESENKSIYNAEYGYLNPSGSTVVKTPTDFSNNTGVQQGGSIVIGYAPRSGSLAWTRHELEFGTFSHSNTFNHVSQSNPMCGGYKDDGTCSSQFASASYKMRQRTFMYNLYIQPNMQDNLSFFIGGGVGFAFTTTTISGASISTQTTASTSGGAPVTTTKTDSSESQIFQSKNAISPAYSAFIGATYDITNSIVFQAKIKGMLIDKATQRYSSGSIRSINQSSDQRYIGQDKLLKVVMLEMGVLFGW